MNPKCVSRSSMMSVVAGLSVFCHVSAFAGGAADQGPKNLPEPHYQAVESYLGGALRYQINFGDGMSKAPFVNLTDDKTNIVVSNYVAGAMLWHLIHKINPSLNLSKDYVYGALLGQLLQNSDSMDEFSGSTDWIDSNQYTRAAKLTHEKAGPYAIKGFDGRLESGIGLANFIALRKGLGYGIKEQDAGPIEVMPDSFDQIYFGPMAAAYHLYNKFLSLNVNASPPSGVHYADYVNQCMGNLSGDQASRSKYNISDIVLSSTIDPGVYSFLIGDYFRICARMYQRVKERNQSRFVGDYTLDDGTYKSKIGFTGKPYADVKYPREIRAIVDQIDGNDPYHASGFSKDVSVKVKVADLQNVFGNVMGVMTYVRGGKLDFIQYDDASMAMSYYLERQGINPESMLDLKVEADRNKFFKIMDESISSLESRLQINFGKVVQN